MKILAPLLGLLLMAACAAGERTVVDGDRALSDQNSKGAVVIQKALGDVAVQLAALQGPLPAAIMTGLKLATSAAITIQANADQQLVNWGGAEKVKDPQPFSAQESDKQRKTSDEEHKSISWWHGAAAAGLAALGWVAKSVGLGWIPYVGPFLQRFMPAVAVGATAQQKINAGLQVAVDEGRVKLDQFFGTLKERLKEKLPDEADRLIDQLELPDLKDIVCKELERRGVLPQNTILYDANPDTGTPSQT